MNRKTEIGRLEESDLRDESKEVQHHQDQRGKPRLFIIGNGSQARLGCRPLKGFPSRSPPAIRLHMLGGPAISIPFQATLGS